MGNTRALLELAKKTAIEAGNLLRDGFGRLRSGDISLKGFGDYVTAMDHASEDFIIDSIKKNYSDHRIYAEESGANCQKSEYRWLIDPLDGTANYVHGIPYYSVSIAVQQENKLLVGVVYHVEQNELFTSEIGQGACLNDQPIFVSKRESLDKAMICTGFPWRSKPYINSYIKAFHHLFLHSAGMRRLGSAAMDLSYVACGRFDGFWEMHLRPYDIGAGILLVKEAGGVVSDFRGYDSSLDTGNVVAANPRIHKQLVEMTKKHLGRVPGIKYNCK